MSEQLAVIPGGAQGEEKRRVHVLVYSSDWEKVGLMYGDSVKRGNVMRMLLRDYIKRIEAKREQRL